uniref:thiamine phosphate synthase n=1 Tax=Mucochytrium quahogii TaxID=96639 RepID=A0A7S2WHT0_9STRA|mmetsp:Transcript_8854/g.14373  ORF Transcript_8854/g.14373 Transcript_8854/m.14373 type:complete len:221 (-) Transcript_8854:12-674(-)
MADQGKGALDVRLYAVTDPHICVKYGHTLVSSVEAAILGGATVVQYRDKDADEETFERRAAELCQVIKKYPQVRFIVNDRIEVAFQVGAHGVHLGQDDGCHQEAREMCTKYGLLLGISCNTVEMALEAERVGADYLGVGAVFGTSTKLNARQDTGLETLKAITDRVTVPVVGIGGIGVSNVARVFSEGGANGAAIVSGIFDTENIEQRARELLLSITKTN